MIGCWPAPSPTPPPGQHARRSSRAFAAGAILRDRSRSRGAAAVHAAARPPAHPRQAGADRSRRAQRRWRPARSRSAIVLSGDPTGRPDGGTGPARAQHVPDRQDRRRTGRADGRQHRDRRDRVLPDSVLAGARRTARPLPEAVLAKIDAYMKNGGMIIFDTRDAGTSFMPSGFNLQGDRSTPLQRLLGNLDIPRLEAGAGNACADQVVLPAEGVPRPLRQRPALGRGREHPRDSGAGGRRGASTACRRSSSRRTTSPRPGRWMSAISRCSRSCPAAKPQREMAFRVGVNIVDVRAHRQLQGRSGARARAARAAGELNDDTLFGEQAP